MLFAKNEFQASEYDPDYCALCAVLFPLFQFYSSLEKGQLYIFRVGSGQVNLNVALSVF